MRPPRSSIAWSLVLVAVLTVVSACDMGGDDNANGGLVNTSWSVVSIDGEATLADARPTLLFAPEGLSGTTGCNSYGGTFRTDGDRITIDVGAMTEMACDGPRGAQEARVLEALPAVTTWRQREDGALELGGGAAIVAVPLVVPGAPGVVDPNQPVEDGLPAAAWTLVGIDDTVDLAGVRPTLEFLADGTVAGLGGCNRFSGPVTIDGSGISFGGLTSTRMACGDPADAVERAYLGALEGVTSWSVDGAKQLVLEGPSGRLVFTAG